MAKSAHMPEWLKFFKRKVNFFELLTEQAETTLSGLRGLRDWLETDSKDKCQSVHELEHKADRQKMAIEEKLRQTMVTPFDREDIYDISARMDLIINATKRFVEDLEYLPPEPTDEHIRKMADALVEGGEHVVAAIKHLENNLKEAGSAANKARKTESAVEQFCREGLKVLLTEERIEVRARQQHAYDCMCRISERMERLGEKLLHVSIKLG